MTIKIEQVSFISSNMPFLKSVYEYNGKKVSSNSLIKREKMEIERKFLIQAPLPNFIKSKKIIQAYIFFTEQKELRVRICDQVGTVAIKIDLGNMSREDFEFPISLSDALKLIDLGTIHPPIEKTRYIVFYEGMRWEVDVFEGKNQGLILAEIELNSPEQVFSKPAWVGDEVTYDKKYYNVNLYQNPYSEWKF